MADKAKSYYFPHDSNARNDQKITILRLNMGWEGYGLYWATLEIMREHNQGKNKYKLPSELAPRLLSLQLNIDEITASTFLATAKSSGLFEDKKGLIFSPSFLERMKRIEKRASKSSENGKLGGRPKKPSNNLVGFQNESKTKPIKRKEKEKKTTTNSVSSFEAQFDQTASAIIAAFKKAQESIGRKTFPDAKTMAGAKAIAEMIDSGSTTISEAEATFAKAAKDQFWQDKGLHAIADNFSKVSSLESRSNSNSLPKDKICCGTRLDSRSVATSGLCYYDCKVCGISWKVDSNGNVLKREVKK